ncbi:FAD:protein FMN transferase [Aquimarina sp. BL5]|uniref:FAD:protein FMN transferase n=1 Tax=Aquimarina sp. BL5 TaxID=1714860 RepID=UPI000E5477F6|nr:FAD:protein FMN transferase [Aquimarina sp. BL5]AXT51000.1 FAD:protein FMN transferase [Aquimarina sp. BL5]RKM95615.1 FAD:protein FMN transferase [Aquimarina sp. BL5]
MIRNLLIYCLLVCLLSCKKTPEQYLNYTSGDAFGTTFSVQFIDKNEIDLSASYDSIINVINTSMSTYQNDSDISKINFGDITVSVDNHFKNVFNTSKRIYKETEGVFDPTVGVLVNAWDFGPEGKIVALDSLKIASLLISVGLDKVTLRDNKIIKQHPKTFIDFNALAKGYAVDVFTEFLEAKNFENYLVEIGGEIRGKGSNLIKVKPWKIGVEDPNFDQTQSYSKVLSLKNEAMATSGSYRKFKLDENGNRYAHIIDTKTGYPHKSNLLSVSILAKTCMEADAYATALMSMGLERSKQFLNKHPELKVYFIYEDDKKELKTLTLNGFPDN